MTRACGVQGLDEGGASQEAGADLEGGDMTRRYVEALSVDAMECLTTGGPCEERSTEAAGAKQVGAARGCDLQVRQLLCGYSYDDERTDH